MKGIRIYLLLATLVLASCSSIQTIKNPEPVSSDGLAYYMPKKDFVVTITVKNKKVGDVVLGTTASYPDHDAKFVLKHGSNFFGKNTIDIGVNESGLLSSANSTTQSNVNEIFKSLATTAGFLSKSAPVKAELGTTTCADGDHTFIYTAPVTDTQCGVSIKIEKKPSKMVAAKVASKTNDTEYSGVFYRQNEPYLMSVSGGGVNVASVVFSPSDSATEFLPASRTFFSNNSAEFAFKDGVPTKYKQETEGEIVALLKLPSDVLSAYFSAIGALFDNFKSKDTKEADALAASLKLELQKMKSEACVAAIKAKDEVKIKELDCE